MDSILFKEDPWQLYQGLNMTSLRSSLGAETEGRGKRKPERLRGGGWEKTVFKRGL